MPPKASRRRLDQLLVDRGLVESRARAQALIMAGEVLVAGMERPKAGMTVAEDVAIEVIKPMPWASRGGLKLEGALADFGLTGTLSGTWLDCGASTGGFTDVLLSNGVARVYAIDVGYGQLALKLREDPRVVVIEKFNIRHLTRAVVSEDLDGATLDLSFISARLVLPVLAPFLKSSALVLLMFKPQFEGKPDDVGKGGVVRDPAVRARLLGEFSAWAEAAGWHIRQQVDSRVHGPSGNIETFVWLEKTP